MSKKDPQRLSDYLEHILQALEKIHRYVGDIDQVAFLINEEKQDAVIRNFEVLGEASENIRKLYPEFSKQYPDFPLRQSYGMRNALAHGYFKVDLEMVWVSIEVDLPLLEAQVRDVIQALACD